MDNYNSIEAQYPTEYGGLWDDDIEARIEAAIAETERDPYEEALEEFDDDFDSDYENEIQDLHLELERVNLDLAQHEVDNALLDKSVTDLRTELDAAYVALNGLQTEHLHVRDENVEQKQYIMELRQRLANAERHADELNDHIVELTMTL